MFYITTSVWEKAMQEAFVLLVFGVSTAVGYFFFRLSKPCWIIGLAVAMIGSLLAVAFLTDPHGTFLWYLFSFIFLAIAAGVSGWAMRQRDYRFPNGRF
ncbi:MAG: hypothetical protein ACREGH_00130 [Minisyncoccia bacterium]